MKKYYVLFLLILALYSCDFSKLVNYSTAEKLENKVFSYYSQDIDNGDTWVWLKKSIEFSTIDKKTNTINVIIKSYHQTSQDVDNSTIENSNERILTKYDIKNNSIDNIKLLKLELDKKRYIDECFSFDNLTYENCNQKIKWAKLLENNYYEYYYGGVKQIYSFYTFYEINIENQTIPIYHKSYADGGINMLYEIDNVYDSMTSHGNYYKCDNYKNITDTSFACGSDNDGNGVVTPVKTNKPDTDL